MLATLSFYNPHSIYEDIEALAKLPHTPTHHAPHWFLSGGYHLAPQPSRVERYSSLSSLFGSYALPSFTHPFISQHFRASSFSSQQTVAVNSNIYASVLAELIGAYA
jgi:hypothetical protein